MNRNDSPWHCPDLLVGHDVHRMRLSSRPAPLSGMDSVKRGYDDGRGLRIKIRALTQC